MNSDKQEEELIQYGEPGIASKNAKIPRWLMFIYIILPLWGLLWGYLFWNGSYGWLDRGYWNELQKAANTTFPSKNLNDPT